ncbi:hypothetical protein ISCGN_017461 [Ixodes scapularis]
MGCRKGTISESKSGTEEQYSEKERLLQDVAELARELGYKPKTVLRERTLCAPRKVSAQPRAPARDSAKAARDVAALEGFNAATPNDAAEGENSSGLGATASAADLLEQIYNVAEHQDAVEEPANLSQSMSSSQSSLDEQRPSTPHLAPPRGMQRQNAATLSYLRLRGKRELDIKNRRLALEEKRLAFEMQKHEDEMREKECKRLAKEEEKKTAAALQDGQPKLIQTLIAQLDKQ